VTDPCAYIRIRMYAGIERIYETFPTVCRFRGAGHEADDLRRLMRCYKVCTDGRTDGPIRLPARPLPPPQTNNPNPNPANQEWAHALFPQLAFEDLLDRVQKLSGRARVRKRLEDLREKERERFLVRACVECTGCALEVSNKSFSSISACPCRRRHHAHARPIHTHHQQQASKFGSDYEDRVHEYERTKRLEEARLEEERRRRREELYGTGRAKAAAGAESGEVEVEDLGAVSSVAARRFGLVVFLRVYCLSACLCPCALYTTPLDWHPISPSPPKTPQNAGGGPGGAGAGAARAAGAHRRRARCVTCTHV
jgi:hypothetical protein